MPKSELTPQQRRAKEIGAAVDLLNDAERRRAATSCGLDAGADARAVTAALTSLSRFDVLRALADAAPDAMGMLCDIARWLEAHGIAARTTGCMLVLDRPSDAVNIELSPQEVQLALSWSRARGSDALPHLLGMRRRWQRIAPALSEVTRAADSRRRSRRLDPVKAAIRNQPVFRQPRIDDDARMALSILRPHLLGSADVLRRIARDSQSRAATRLLSDVRHHADAADAALRSGSKPPRVTPQRRKRLVRQYAVLSDVLRFFEDLLALGALAEAATGDTHGLSLWRHRPQLFEVWVLVGVLGWLEERGYRVEPMQTERAASRPRWRLKYANAERPCARVDGPDGTAFVFYQLFRKPKQGERADMPDIALLVGEDPSSSGIWAIDPKHADRQGYSYRDYEATGVRYADSFGARLAVIVEHYPRDDLGKDNPAPLSHNAALVCDARPGGVGMPLLFDLLAPLHPVHRRDVLCIDMSSSFESRRVDAVEELRGALTSDGARVHEKVVLFAGTAHAVRGGHKLLTEGVFPAASGVADGTALGPLLDRLTEMRAEANRIIVVSDGDFDDANWFSTLEQAVGVPAIHYA